MVQRFNSSAVICLAVTKKLKLTIVYPAVHPLIVASFKVVYWALYFFFVILMTFTV
jgi:hypothetical protein